MSQLTPPQPADSRIPVMTIAAAIFLALSLLIAGAVIAGVDPAAALFPPSTALPTLTQPPSSPPATAAVSPTPTPPPGQGRALIILIPPQDDPSGLAQSLPDAIRSALEGSPLVQRVEVRSGQPDPADALEIAWLPGDNGLLRLVFHSRFEPAPVSIDGSLTPYALAAPEQTPLTIETTDGPALAAGLAAAVLELALQPEPGTFDRIRKLQALPSSVGPEDEATNQAIILFALAQAQTAQGDSTMALDTYSQVLRMQPSFQAAALNRASVYLALGDTATAQTTYDSFKDVAAYQDVMRYNQAVATLSGEDQAAALLSAEGLVKENPSSAWRVNMRGYVRWRSGDAQAALDDFKRAADLAPGTPVPLLNQAEALTALHRYDEALAIYSALTRIDPKNPAYRFKQALAYEAGGNTPSALDALSQAIALDDQDADAYLERARIEAHAGEFDKAQTDAGQVLTLNPDSGPAYQVIGDCLLAQEQWAQAEKAYTSAVKLGENNADLFAGRGWAHHRQEELTSAVADYRQAISLGNNDSTLLFRLGFALVDLNQRKDALNALLGAVNRGMDTAEAHAALALALDLNSRSDDANVEYRHAVALDPRFADRAFLIDQPLWSPLSVDRALAIVKRLK